MRAGIPRRFPATREGRARRPARVIRYSAVGNKTPDELAQPKPTISRTEPDKRVWPFFGCVALLFCERAIPGNPKLPPLRRQFGFLLTSYIPKYLYCEAPPSGGNAPFRARQEAIALPLEHGALKI